MENLSKKLKTMIQVGYWPGFIVGMYPSQFAYKPISVDFKKTWEDTEEINLYYHIPFCKWKCSYCTFFSVVANDKEYFEKYIDKVNEQFNFYNNIFKKKVNIKSICFGGGAPNLVPLSGYEKVFDTLSKGNITFDTNLEPSMEISPELITSDYIEGISKLGVKRLSLGVQSLKGDLRKSINRDKNLNILDIVDEIRKRNMNINIDVINGLIGQNEESFMDTLKEIVKFAPETISIYLLSGEKSSVFKKSQNLMTTKEKYKLFDVYYEYLLNNGYRCESHVKFVRENQNSTHQQKIYEYNGVETLGLGSGARSYNTQIHYGTPWVNEACTARAAIDEYIEKDFRDLPWIGFKMNEDENKRRFIVYSFFMGELNNNTYSRRFNTSFFDDFPNEIEALIDNGLIDISDRNNILLTKKGRKYTDLVGTLFWSRDINGMFRGTEC